MSEIITLFEVYPLTSKTRKLKPLTATTVFVGAIRALSCRNVS